MHTLSSAYTIERLEEPEDSPRVILVIAGGVSHIQDLIGRELAIEISPLDVNLVKFEVKPVSHGDDCARRRQSHNWSVSVEIVDSFNLAKPLRNEASLVADDFARGVLLGLEDPLGPYHISSWGGVLESPGTGGAQSVELLMDGLLPEGPVGASFCLNEVAWFECF
jgi:hypothetical protein